MHNLIWELKQIMDSNRDNSYSTQQSRLETFTSITNDSTEVGFRRITVESLTKEKCIQAYVNYWKQKGLSSGTMKNRMSHIRWAAKKINTLSRIPSNQKLGIQNREIITNEDKSINIKDVNLNQVSDQNIKDTLIVQAAFGLRREEGIKINAVIADKGNKGEKGEKLSLKASWCKGGRAREIPILTNHQREVIDTLKERYGNNSLIPANKTYKQQKDIYKNTTSKLGLGIKGHALRHQYAQDRYKELTGNECPVKDGKSQKDMTKAERAIDREARLTISEELGHSREQITSNYLGS